MTDVKNIVSIIIVTYKRLAYLKIAIDAALKQTYKSIEIIVVSDGEEPGTRRFIEEHYGSKVFYHYVAHAGYPAKARNLGIEKAKGKFLAFCDDDDLWLPDKIEKQIKVFNNNLNLALCCSDRFVIDGQGGVKEGAGLNWLPAKKNLSTLLLTNFITYSSVLIKKEILLKTGLFADDIRFRAIEDYHLWIRVANFGNIYFLNEKLVYYRVHDNNITRKLSVGVKSIFLIYKDLFPGLRLNYYQKLKAYLMLVTKYTIYKVKGV